MKLLLLLLLALPTSAPLPPPAVAKLCFNQVVHRSELRIAWAQVRWEGCNGEVIMVPVDSHHYLVYGVQVYIGEKPDQLAGGTR